MQSSLLAGFRRREVQRFFECLLIIAGIIRAWDPRVCVCGGVNKNPIISCFISIEMSLIIWQNKVPQSHSADLEKLICSTNRPLSRSHAHYASAWAFDLHLCWPRGCFSLSLSLFLFSSWVTRAKSVPRKLFGAQLLSEENAREKSSRKWKCFSSTYLCTYIVCMYCICPWTCTEKDVGSVTGEMPTQQKILIGKKPE